MQVPWSAISQSNLLPILLSGVWFHLGYPLANAESICLLKMVPIFYPLKYSQVRYHCGQQELTKLWACVNLWVLVCTYVHYVQNKIPRIVPIWAGKETVAFSTGLLPFSGWRLLWEPLTHNVVVKYGPVVGKEIGRGREFLVFQTEQLSIEMWENERWLTW